TAEKNVKTRLTMEKIIRDENIEVTDADVDARLAEIASNAKKDLDEYKKSVSVQQLDYIKNDLLFGKLIKFLKEANTFEVKAEEKPAAKTTKTTAKKTAVKPAAKPAAKTAAKTTAKKTVKDTTEGSEKKTAKQPKKQAEKTETK
ncbi:MAG: hypothetical protein ACI4S9_06570, partial [Christensenellales bacterium]